MAYQHPGRSTNSNMAGVVNPYKRYYDTAPPCSALLTGNGVQQSHSVFPTAVVEVEADTVGLKEPPPLPAPSVLAGNQFTGYQYNVYPPLPPPSSPLTSAGSVTSGPPPTLSIQPSFPWSTGKGREPTTTEAKKGHVSDLPFVPIPLNAEQLTSMTQAIQKQAEDTRSCSFRFLEGEGAIDTQLPNELKEMFQPLYCKLCSLTLSSHVVAMDHYKGKKHKKKIDQWLLENKVRLKNNSSEAQVAEVLLQGTITRVRKRPAPVAQSGPPSTKKKKASEGGPNYAFCTTCKISLTSQVVALQHYSGKSHKAKLLRQGMASNSVNLDYEDRTFGIGKAFRNKPVSQQVTQTTQKKPIEYYMHQYWDGIGDT